MHFPESFPDLETKRLKLTELRIEDAKTLLTMRSDGRISEFIAREKMHTEGEAEDLINKCLNAFKNKAGIAWAGRKKQNDILIGTCGFNSIEHENNHAEIGGEMATQF